MIWSSREIFLEQKRALARFHFRKALAGASFSWRSTHNSGSMNSGSMKSGSMKRDFSLALDFEIHIEKEISPFIKRKFSFIPIKKRDFFSL